MQAGVPSGRGGKDRENGPNSDLPEMAVLAISTFQS
jgi:hypothetical protein